MTPERLRQLIETYGARADRWPAGEREDASAMVARDPECTALLARELALDMLLARYPAPVAHAALIGRVLAGVPRSSLSRVQAWWAGLGFAAAGLAGMIVGAGAAPHLIDRHRAVADEQVTAFSPVDIDEDIGPEPDGARL